MIPNPIGTAPGIRAEIDGKVIYAVPGVPYEMQLMVKDHVLPDLLARSGEAAVIVSRSLKTWGASESGLAEMIARPGRHAGEPDDRVPRPRHRGHRRAPHREGGDRRTPRGR